MKLNTDIYGNILYYTFSLFEINRNKSVMYFKKLKKKEIYNAVLKM